MKIVIAKNVEQAKQFTEAVFASHVVVMEGVLEASGGFTRLPANPTLGYAKLHYATGPLPVRFRGIAVGRPPLGIDFPFMISVGKSEKAHLSIEVPLPVELTLDQVGPIWELSQMVELQPQVDVNPDTGSEPKGDPDVGELHEPSVNPEADSPAPEPNLSDANDEPDVPAPGRRSTPRTTRSRRK